MKQLPIPVIGNNKEILNKLLGEFVSNTIVFKPFDPKKHLVGYDKILIIEPYEVKNKLVNIHTIWKRYLLEKGMQKQLIIAGFEQNINPNYVNILSLEKDLEIAIRTSKNLTSDCKYPLNHEDIINKLRVFLKGHGEKSIPNEFISVLHVIHNMNASIKRTISTRFAILLEESYKKSRDDWRKFTAKWEMYINYFDNCPFFEEKEIIERNINLLNPFFRQKPTQKLFKEIDCFERIELIKKQLTKMQKYVFDSKNIDN